MNTVHEHAAMWFQRREPRHADAAHLISALPHPEPRYGDLSPEDLELWAATLLDVGHEGNEVLWDERMKTLSRSSRMKLKSQVRRRPEGCT